MRNKILAIIITIIVIAGLLAAAYLLFYKNAPAEQGNSQTQRAPKLTKISETGVISPIPSYDGSAIWYFNIQGHLFRHELVSGKISEYPLPTSLKNFRQALWPAKGHDFIAIGSEKTYFDSKQNKFVLLPANIQSLDFLPDGQRIAYVWKSGDGKTQSLYMGNADASGFTKITDVFWPDLTVNVSPDGNSALLLRSAVEDTNKIYKANLKTGEFTTVVDAGRNTEVRWIDQNRFLFVSVEEGKYQLKMFDLSANKISDLNTSATLSQVAVDPEGRYLYAYLKNGDTGSIYKINLTDNQSTDLYDLSPTITPQNLFLNDRTIMFINSQDNRLYSLTQ